MCASRKQIVTAVGAVAALALTAGTAAAADPALPRYAGQADASPAKPKVKTDATAGSLALGESRGGVTDRAYIAAPPNWSFVVEREPGSFLDCGEGMSPRLTDEDGRDLARLSCGVTLTETIAIPAAAESARIIVHF